MPKDIDKIMNDVEHNLNKVSIKEANNLSTQKEEKALGQNLVEILESDFWKECIIDRRKREERAKELYPEFFMPIVAEDPLTVIYERMGKVLALWIDSFTPSTLGIEVIPFDSDVNYMTIEECLRDLIWKYYLPPRNKEWPDYINGINIRDLSAIKELINVYKLLASEYINEKRENYKANIQFNLFVIMLVVEEYYASNKPLPT